MASLNLSTLLPLDPDGAGPRINNAGFVDGKLRLTAPLDGQDYAGAAFSEQIQLKNDTSFTAEFQFQTGFADSPEGFTFIIQNDPLGRAALGGDGPGLGYRPFTLRGDQPLTITNALAIELDTLGNSGYDNFEDVSANSIEVVLIDADGNRILKDFTGADQPQSFFQTDFTGFDLNNGNIHTAWIEYDGATQILAIFLATGPTPTKPDQPAFSTNLSGEFNNLEAILGGNNAYVGFTAATGGPEQYHDVLSFDFQSTSTADVPPTNQQPSIVLPASPQSTEVNTSLVFSEASGNGISVGDPENDLLTLRVEAPTGSTLTLASAAGVDISADPDGDESLIALGSAAALNAALNGLRFVPTSGFSGQAQITFEIDDDTTDNVPALLAALKVDVGSSPSPQPGDASLLVTEQHLLYLKGVNQPKVAQFDILETGKIGPLEIGFFVVDDEQGTINGLTPGDNGYVEASRQTYQTIFSTLGDADIRNLDLSRILSLNPDGSYYSFFVIQNGTVDSLLKTGDGNVFFGSPFVGQGANKSLSSKFLESEGAYELSWDLNNDNVFDDLNFKVSLPDSGSVPLGSNLQGLPESEIIDLRDLTGQVQLTVEVFREAAFNNVVGFYRIQDAQGSIFDEFGNVLSPDDVGYAKAAVAQQVGSFFGENGIVRSESLQLESGQILAPFLIVNGTLEQLLDSNPGNNPSVYFPFLGANSDGADHVRLLGNNTFGFEDLAGGGDFDYDDLIVKVTVQPV